MKVGHNIVNPRRYSAQVHGYNLAPGRYVIPGCGNERCVNPAHTRFKSDGSGLDPNAVLYIDFEHFGLPPGYVARLYGFHDKLRVLTGRQNTLKLIYDVRTSSLPLNRLAKRFNVPEAFIKRIRALDEITHRGMIADPNEGLYESQDNYDPRGEKFKPPFMK
jgi:hypothetical protein